MTGPMYPLARTLTLIGGWGLTRPQVGPTLADVAADPEDRAFDPPRTSFFKARLRGPALPPAMPPALLDTPARGRRGLVWKELLMSRTAIAACLTGAFVAGLLVFRAGTRSQPGRPPAVQAAAAVPAQPQAAQPLAAQPAADPEPAPAIAEPAPEPVVAPKPTIVERPRPETPRHAAAVLPRTARARPAVVPPRPARKPQPAASAKGEWVDPFSNGAWADPFSDDSWVNLPSKNE